MDANEIVVGREERDGRDSADHSFCRFRYPQKRVQRFAPPFAIRHFYPKVQGVAQTTSYSFQPYRNIRLRNSDAPLVLDCPIAALKAIRHRSVNSDLAGLPGRTTIEFQKSLAAINLPKTGKHGGKSWKNFGRLV
jgi:hypothetical protein